MHFSFFNTNILQLFTVQNYLITKYILFSFQFTPVVN